VATTTFLAHLTNQRVVSEVIPLQIIFFLLLRPTDDSVEIAVGFMREVGAFLLENTPRASVETFERFRAILNESGIDKRVQYMVEILFQVRRDKFKDNPTLPEGLDLVEAEDQITHLLELDDESITVEDGLSAYLISSSLSVKGR
jgi:pre-mRNA-splicing factor CWC22